MMMSLICSPPQLSSISVQLLQNLERFRKEHIQKTKVHVHSDTNIHISHICGTLLSAMSCWCVS